MASVGQRKRFPVDASSGTDEKKGAASLLRELKLVLFPLDFDYSRYKTDDANDYEKIKNCSPTWILLEPLFNGESGYYDKPRSVGHNQNTESSGYVFGNFVHYPSSRTLVLLEVKFVKYESIFQISVD
jgi:hypothetical protein